MNRLEKIWKKRYDQLATMDIPDWQKSSWWSVRTLSIQKQFLLRQAKEIMGGAMRIADVGCGPGYYAKWLAEMGHQVYGIDYSLKILHIAKAKTNIKQALLCQADANDLPFNANSFDLVLGMGILLSAEDPERLILQMHRILKANAKLIITTPVQHYLWELPFYPLYCLCSCGYFPAFDSFPIQLIKSRSFIRPRPCDDPASLMKRYKIEKLRSWLANTGFKEVKIEYQGRFTHLPFLLNSYMANISAVKK